jgi:hypothetical protein
MTASGTVSLRPGRGAVISATTRSRSVTSTVSLRRRCGCTRSARSRES